MVDVGKRARHDELHRNAIHHMSGGTVAFHGTGGAVMVPHMIGGGFSLRNGLKAASKAATFLAPVAKVAAPIAKAAMSGGVDAAVDAAVGEAGKALTNASRQKDVLKRLKALASRPEL